MDEEILIRYVELPISIRGMTQYDEDGTPLIFINARHSFTVQQEAIAHELEHVRRDDGYNDLSIKEAEDDSAGTFITIPVFNLCDLSSYG